MSEQYARLAQVYDDFMYDTPYADWAAYIVELLRERGVHGELLEYACGTGNITLELARAGYRVRGLDIATDMLDIAAGKLRGNAIQPSLICADMVDFRLERGVDAAVCACDGVNYILTQDRLARFFANTYDNIKDGGIFLFDISSAYKLEHVLGDEFFFDDADTGTLFWQNHFDATAGLLRMDISLFVPSGGVYHRYEECHIQRAWQAGVLAESLLAAGFGQVETFRFMTRQPVGSRDERIQFVAHKGEKV